MEKVKYIIIAVTVLVATIAAFITFSHSEEAKVIKQFKYLAQKMNKTPREITLTSAAKANKIRDLFTETCTIHAPAYSFSKDISSKEGKLAVLSHKEFQWVWRYRGIIFRKANPSFTSWRTLEGYPPKN